MKKEQQKKEERKKGVSIMLNKKLTNFMMSETDSY